MLVFDEMKICEDLVFDTESGTVIGYVDTGDINLKLKDFEARVKGKTHESEVATHMLTLYVRGIFTNLGYPLAQFPTAGILLTCNVCKMQDFF